MDTKIRHHDVVVGGGGTAGTIAAIAAARSGADTLLVERYGTLGGISTGGMINFYNSFHSFAGEKVIGGIPWEIVERLVEMNATPGPKTDYSGLTGSLVIYNQKLLELLLFDMVEKSGSKLLLQSYLYDVLRDGDRLQGVSVVNKSGRMILTGDVFVDATGDADVAALCGAPYEQTERERTQPVTLEIRVGGVNTQKVRQYIFEHPEQFELEMIQPQEIFDQKYLVQWCVGIPSLQKYDEDGELKYGLTHNQIWFNTHEPEASRGIFTLNATRVANIDGTDAEDLTRAEIDTRKEIPILLNYFRGNIPGFEDAYLIDMASQMGVRETRRIVGDYTITKEDVLQGRDQPDGIARAVSQIDIHGSNEDKKKFFWTKLDKTELSKYRFSYGIPYRAMLPQGLDNVIVAGRPISSTRDAHGSVRFMPPCMAIGEAAGTAAAQCVQSKCGYRGIDVARLQRTLRENGAIL